MAIQLSAADLAALQPGGPGIVLQGPVAVAPPGPVVSPSGTLILKGSTAAIIDAAGNAWTITAGGLVAVQAATATSATPDTTTANVTKLAYVNGLVWQKNTANLWWSKTAPGAGWLPGTGTATPPIAGA